MVRHAWEITLREFIEIVRRGFGIEVHYASAALVAGWFLRQGQRLYPIPVLDEDDILPLPLLRYLCKAFGLPPELFHLDPLDPEEDGDE